MVANIEKDVSKVEAFEKLMEMGFQKAASKMMKTGKSKKLDEALCMYMYYMYCDCLVLDL